MTTFQLTDAQAADAREHGLVFAPAVESYPDNYLMDWRHGPIYHPPVEAGAQITVTVPCECPCHTDPDLWENEPDCDECDHGHVPAFTATVTQVLPGRRRGQCTDHQPHWCWYAPAIAKTVDQDDERPIDLTVWPDVAPGNWYALILTDIKEQP